MRRIFYFILSFIVPLIISSMAHAWTVDEAGLNDYLLSVYISYGYTDIVSNIQPYATPDADLLAWYSTQPVNNSWTLYPKNPPASLFSDSVARTLTGYCKSNTTTHVVYISARWIQAGFDGFTPVDSDGDGIVDDLDAYPDDSSPYLMKRISFYTDDGTLSGSVIGECWITDRGDYILTGTSPEVPEGEPDVMPFMVHDPYFIDPAVGGYEAIGLSGDAVRELTMPQNETYTTAAPTGVAGDYSATTGMSSGTAATGSESDNEALQGTMTNTSVVAANTKRMGDYMQDMNKALTSINRAITTNPGPTAEQIGQAVASAMGSGSGLTAGDVGSAVGDELVDEDYHHDSSQTAGLGDYSFGTKFDDEKTRYMTRYTTFKDTLSSTPLGGLKDNLIGSIPSGGSSSVSMNIGKWGNTSDQFVSFDFNDYSQAWDVLRFVLPILTGFACLRILFLKQH